MSDRGDRFLAWYRTCLDGLARREVRIGLVAAALLFAVASSLAFCNH